MTADVETAEIVDVGVPVARVQPLASPALTQWILAAIEGLQQQGHRGLGGTTSERDMWIAIGGVQALLGVLDLIAPSEV